MIRGERVVLRAIEAADTERCHRWVNDPEVTRFLAMRFPMSMLQEQKWVERERDPMRELELAIDTLDGVHIGSCGLMHVNMANRESSLGIVIGEKEYWGQGYGGDAMITLCGFGFNQMNLHRIHLHVFGYNERAIRCYEKCGFKHEGRHRDCIFRNGEYHDVLSMSILEDEFRALWPGRSCV